MDRYLAPYSEYAYALLRIVAGFLFIWHGTQKLFGFPGGGDPQAFLTLRWFAGVIEFVGGSLIMIGLFGSWAAFIASGQMAAAYFIAHAPQGFWPILNRGVTAALYCFIFLYIATRGSGIWSVDAALGQNTERRPLARVGR